MNARLGADELRRRRLELGLTRRELARRAAVDLSVIEDAETHGIRIYDHTASLLAGELGIDTSHVPQPAAVLRATSRCSERCLPTSAHRSRRRRSPPHSPGLPSASATPPERYAADFSDSARPSRSAPATKSAGPVCSLHQRRATRLRTS